MNHRRAAAVLSAGAGAGSGEVEGASAEPVKAAAAPAESRSADHKEWATTTIPASIVPGEVLDASTAWELFATRVPSFALRYMVYSRLRSDGWVCEMGWLARVVAIALLLLSCFSFSWCFVLVCVCVLCDFCM